MALLKYRDPVTGEEKIVGMAGGGTDIPVVDGDPADESVKIWIDSSEDVQDEFYSKAEVDGLLDGLTAEDVGAASHEFGYWTPIFPEGSGFVLYGATNARYLKIGRFVYANMAMKLTTTDAADVRFSGLPYTPVNISFGTFSIEYNASAPSVHGGTVVATSAATCLLKKNWATYSEMKLTPSEAKTGNVIHVSIMYESVEA